MPRRAPGWPLAATLGAHLLLAWCWLQARPPTAEVVPGLREFLVVPVFRPAAPPVAAPAASATAPSMASNSARNPQRNTQHNPQRGAGSRPRPDTAADGAQAIAGASAPAPSPPSAKAADAPLADPLATPSMPSSHAGESAAARAMREAGTTDRGLRSGTPSTLHAADTPYRRFAAALEGAHRDTSRTLASDSYTTPDGVTIYRFRRGNKVYCRTTGHVRPNIGNLAEGGGIVNFDRAGGEGAAGLVECPSHDGFKGLSR